MKKIIYTFCVVICAVMLLSANGFAEHMGIKNTGEDGKIKVLQLLEIMNGDENGDLNLDAPVTRAEFVKMIISASVHKDAVGKTSAVSVFPDVTSSHWAAGYVSVAVKNGLVNGYLDGFFKPENKVRLEEAVIVTLKLLGYTNEDFQGTYPEAQLLKYEEIDLDTDILAQRGDTLTRRECMKLIYNVLCTKTKAGAYYCTTLGYATDIDNTIDYLALLESSMSGPYVNLDTLSWRDKVSFEENADIIIYRNGKQSEQNDIKEYDVYYFNDKIKTIWFYSDTVSGVCSDILPSKSSPSSVVVGGKTYLLDTDEAVFKFSTYGTLKQDMLVTLILGKDKKVVDAKQAGLEVIGEGENQASYNEVVMATLDGPYITKENGKLLKDTKIILEDAIIYKNNKQENAAVIRKNNVYYYSELLNTVWLYDKKVSGTVDAILPDRVTPTSVVISGKTFVLESELCKYDFSSLGDVSLGDRVTLLLGKDGNVAGVVKGQDAEQETVYGVVLSTSNAQYTDNDGNKYMADIVNVLATDAGVYTYKSSVAYDCGTPVKIVINDERINISRLQRPQSVSGAAEAAQAIKEGRIAPDAQIIEYYNSDNYSSVLKSRISGKEIWYSDIIYCHMEDSQITHLILDNYTGDLVEYGLLTEVVGSTYEYILDDTSKVYISKDSTFMVSEGPAYFVFSETGIQKIANIKANTDISYISENKAYDKQNIQYEIADNVRVYIYEDGEYKTAKIEDVNNKTYPYMKGYYDKSGDYGGKIRVIVAN